jgi:uncharacterized protein YndB with AHSA1/START domain
MQTTAALNITTPTDCQIVIMRPFDAPRRLVWQAMTRPERIRRWLFLPPGWTMSRCDEDLRVGGAFRWEWTGTDGQVAMALGGVYREVVPHERLVRTEKFDVGCQPQAGEQLATLEFLEQGGGTLVKITVVYPSQEARDAALASGMERGMGAGYDKLAALLAAGESREG